MRFLKKFSLKKRIYLLLSLILCLLLGGIGIFLLTKPQETGAAWWNETWTYRKEILITNGNSADLEDFQISFVIDTATLITDGKMQSNCSDIRVTDWSGNLLPHWVEENNPGCNNINTKVWVRVPNVYKGTNATTILVYYGNAGATSVERPKNVFEFFEDMETWEGWTTYDSGQVSQSSTRAFAGTYSAYKTTASDPNGAYKEIGSTLGRDVILEFFVNRNSTYTGGAADRVGLVDNSGNGYGWVFIHPGTIAKDIRTAYAGTYTSTAADTGYMDTWVKAQLVIASDNSIISKRYIGETLIGEHSSTDSSYSSFTRLYILGGFDYWVDNVTIRKYATVEPTTNTSSTEEVSPAPIAYWKLDEGTGATAYDSSGQGIHGSVVGTPAWQNESFCVSGPCMQFNASEYISLGNPQTLQITGSQTISMWLKPSNFSARRNPYAKAYGGEGTITQETSGVLNYYYGTAGGNTTPYQAFGSSQSLTLNEWNHVTLVRDLENMKLYWYINGVKTNEANASYAQATASSLDAFIANGYTSRYAGLIDEVKIYPYARTPEQVKADYIVGSSTVGSKVVLGDKAETASTSLTSNLIGYWKFDEGSGTTAYDSSGNSNNGTITGASWVNEGRVGKALSFNGTSDYVSVASVTGLNTGNTTHSISAWVKPVTTPTTRQWPLLLGAASAGNHHWLYNTNGTMSLGPWSGGASQCTITPDSNEWNYIVTTFDGSNFNCYKNGSLVESNTGASFNLSSNALDIAKVQNAEAYFNGIIDEVKIFNTALTPEQILLDYNKGMTATISQSPPSIGNVWGGSSSSEYCIPGDTSTCNPPVAEWRFDENQGTTAKDISGNGYNTSLQGGVTWAKGKVGSALGLDGVNGYAEATKSISLARNSFSVSSWFKTTSAGDEKIFSLGFSYHPLQIYNGTLRICVNSCTAGTTSINDGKWHHAIVVGDGTSIRAYLDGNLTPEITQTAATGNMTGIPRIGSVGADDGTTSPRFFFEGEVDNLKVYDYARTPAQIAWDYNRGAPIGHWRLDECQGTTAHDVSGNNYHGTINIGATGTQTAVGSCSSGSSTDAWYNGRIGKLNSSLNFDGTDDYVILPSSTKLPSSYSISAWINISSLSGVDQQLPIYGEYTSTSSNTKNYLVVNTSTQTLSFDQYPPSGGSAVSTSTISPNTWYHVVGVQESTSFRRLYINGIQEATSTEIYTGTEPDQFAIGKRMGTTNYEFPGQIDDVRIYNYPLTEEQIKLLYNDNAAVRF